MKEKFVDHRFQARALDTLTKAIHIVDEMSAEGYILTLRQLFYQFVRRNWIENKEKEYKRLGDVVKRGREAGLIDWKAIEDRGRSHYGFFGAQTPAEALAGLEHRLSLDPWADQDYYLEVWVEKQALESVVGRACRKHRARYMACKGYLSTSETYDAGKRFEEAIASGRKPIMIHLGDHDPSGIDMTRDNGSRLSLFTRQGVQVDRIALNMDQIEEYNPPPNPAKVQDSRAKEYMELHGTSSWELDALPPNILHSLIEDHIEQFVDHDKWDKTMEREEELRDQLRSIRQADTDGLIDFAERTLESDPDLLDRIDRYDGWVGEGVEEDEEGVRLVKDADLCELQNIYHKVPTVYDNG